MKSARQLVGSSATVHLIEQEIECAARSDAKVLITGETGVGKEVVAKLIHDRSRRAKEPLITINCAGVPDSLLESELFGHVRGSFTDAYRDKRGWLEQAHGGTIFMDEVGEMSLRMQALLLRFLENGEIQRVGSEQVRSALNVRVIAATNRDLMARIVEKSFREDLFYRLNVIHVAISPLRERVEDIPLLFDHFIRMYCEHHGIEAPLVLDETMARLTAYQWPGNVRELKNVVERLVVRTQSGVITPEDLPREISGRWIAPAVSSPAALAPRPTPDVLFERMSVGGESFWSVVYEPFMSRDLTRQDLRLVVSRGLEETRGNYKALVQFFNLAPGDYKRFLSFLRKYECQMPFQPFRALDNRPGSPRQADAPLSAATN
jgi:DNA-binding NtrC family response regulator